MLPVDRNSDIGGNVLWWCLVRDQRMGGLLRSVLSSTHSTRDTMQGLWFKLAYHHHADEAQNRNRVTTAVSRQRPPRQLQTFPCDSKRCHYTQVIPLAHQPLGLILNKLQWVVGPIRTNFSGSTFRHFMEVRTGCPLTSAPPWRPRWRANGGVLCRTLDSKSKLIRQTITGPSCRHSCLYHRGVRLCIPIPRSTVWEANTS